VANLIENKFSIWFVVTAVGELLAKWKLTPQKPGNAPITAIPKR